MEGMPCSLDILRGGRETAGCRQQGADTRYLKKQKAVYDSCVRMFKVDVSLFENLQVGDSKRSNVKRRCHLLEDREVATQVLQSTLRRFCNLCTYFNIDPMHKHALQLVLLMSSKSKSREKLTQDYVCAKGLDVQIVDSDCAADSIQLVADWCTILKYLKISEVSSFENDPFRQKLRQSMLNTGLSVGEGKRDLIDKLLLYLSVRNTPTPRMIEQFIRDCMPTEREAATKSMQLANVFWDSVYEEEAFNRVLLSICAGATASEQWALDVAKIVQSQDYMSTTIVETARNTGRPRLRHIARTVHAGQIVSTLQSFRSWCSHCGFSTATSTQVQRLLYFIHVQVQPVPEDCYKHLYTAEVLARSRQLAVQEIDVQALQHIIQSMRVYKNNVKDLIDFRSQCLLGLSMETRSKLSLAQVLQLYTCIYQHESVWEACWKSIVPVMNHTISTARARFCEKHAFDAVSVVGCMIACHVGAKTADALAGDNAAD